MKVVKKSNEIALDVKRQSEQNELHNDVIGMEHALAERDARTQTTEILKPEEQESSKMEIMKAEQQAQQTRQTVLEKQQKQQKSQMEDVGSFASKFPSFEEEDEKWEEWTRVFRYWSEQFHYENIFYDEKVVIEKELNQMLKPEDPSDLLNWETPNANAYELRSENKELEQPECENDDAEKTMSMLVKLAKEPPEHYDIDQQKPDDDDNRMQMTAIFDMFDERFDVSTDERVKTLYTEMYEKKELDRKTNLHGLMKAETQPRSAKPPS